MADLIERNGSSDMEIVQGNQLIEGAYKVGIDEMRLLHLLLTKVDSRNAFEPTSFCIHAKEFAQVFQIDGDGVYGRLEKAALTLNRNPIRIYDHEMRSKRGWREYSWFSMIEYSENNDACIKAIFSELVRPYLYELKDNFTKIPLEEIAKLDTPFSVRLFSWLYRYRLLDNYRSNTGCRISMTIDWMKQRAGLDNAYRDYKDFKRYVIEPAIDRINAHTSLTVSYTPIKEGRKITSLEFFFIEQKNKNKQLQATPLRPRLPRRPHVTKGTHAEGIWARQCIELLKGYRDSLKPFDKRLSLADLRKLLSYYKLIGDTLNADKIQVSIDKRQVKVA